MEYMSRKCMYLRVSFNAENVKLATAHMHYFAQGVFWMDNKSINIKKKNKMCCVTSLSFL